MKLTVKQISCMYMVVCMVLTMMPMTAFAETSDKGFVVPLGASGAMTAFAGLDTGVPMRTMALSTSGNEPSLSGSGATTVPQSVYALNNLALPIPGDVLQIEGGVLKDGVPVFDLGDYDDFKESLENGERFPITITRPKGSEAGYPVAVRLDSYFGSNDIGWLLR